MDGVTAAAIGAIAGAVLGTRSLTDGFTLALPVLTGLVLWKYQKLPEPYVILVAALVAREFFVW